MPKWAMPTNRYDILLNTAKWIFYIIYILIFVQSAGTDAVREAMLDQEHKSKILRSRYYFSS